MGLEKLFGFTKRRKGNLRNLLIAGIASSALVLSSCKNGNNNSETDGGNGNDTEQTYVLTEEEVAQITSVRSNKLTFTEPVDYSTGDIIIAGISENSPDGLLRKVTSLSSDRRTVYTVQATLEEAVKEGSFNSSATISPSSVSSFNPNMEGIVPLIIGNSDFNISLNNVILVDIDGDRYTTDDRVIANGNISFNLDVFLNILIENETLKRLNVGTTINDSSTLEVTPPFHFVNADGIIKIADYDFNPFVIGYFPTVPPIPIVVKPELEIFVGLNGEINSLQVSVTQDTGLTFGLSYENGSWNPIDALMNSFDFVPPNLSGFSDFRTFSKARLGFFFYGVAGPYGEAQGFFDLDSNTSSWRLDGGLTADFGIEMSVFSRTIADYFANIISYTTNIAQGEISQPPPEPTTNGKILFVSNIGYNANIYSIKPDGTNITPLADSSEAELDPSPSFDGSEILFCSAIPYSSDDFDIYKMRSDGSGKIQLTSSSMHEYGGVFSPDGTQIAYSAGWMAGYVQIYIMNSDGTDSRQVTNNYGNYHWDVAWSPDGTRIAFSSNIDVDPYSEIYTINPDGSNLTRLTYDNSYSRFPAWSPDGTRIAYTSSKTGNDEIYTMDSDGANQQNNSNSPSTNDQHPSWSPDGTKIVYESREITGYVSLESSEIMIMDVDGSNKTQVTDNNYYDSSPVWSRY